MTLASMTGFSRAHGAFGAWAYAWELKSVNARGLDLRLRVPPAFDAVEIKSRAAIAARLARGSVVANLSAKRVDEAAPARINRAALDRLLIALDEVPQRANLRPAALDGLLSLPGIVDIAQPEEEEAQRAALESHILRALDEALDALLAARREEGAALTRVLRARLDRIRELAAQADALPARQPEAIRERLAQQIARLMESAEGLDAARLHQEAVLIAVKSDIREELDRLKAHVASALDLLEKGGPIGRRLDFFAQELGRESNTLCAKSGDAALTALGLDMKIEIEQWREQVQNIE